MSEGGIFLYAGPAVSVMVAAAFLMAWLHERTRKYVLVFAVAFFVYALAALSQLLMVPSDIGQNTMVSAILYTFAILCLVEGVLARFGKDLSGPVMYGLAGLIIVLMYYFFYVDRNLVARIYVHHFGYGLMFLLAAARIGTGRGRSLMDRVVFWVFVLFGLQFFVRTVLTVAGSEQIQTIDAMRQAGASREAIAVQFRTSPFWQVLNFSLLVSGFLMALVLLAAVALDVIEDLRREGAIDPLTGLSNRRGFERRAAALMADPGSQPVSMIYCDVDHFKRINDAHGHAAGDLVLKALGRILADETGPQDVVARLGGEEFVALLARCNRVGAARFAERVRAEVEMARLPSLPPYMTVTASFGIAERQDEEDLHTLMFRADQLVYAAKAAGRNCIVLDSQAPDLASGD